MRIKNYIGIKKQWKHNIPKFTWWSKTSSKKDNYSDRATFLKNLKLSHPDLKSQGKNSKNTLHSTFTERKAIDQCWNNWETRKTMKIPTKQSLFQVNKSDKYF